MHFTATIGGKAASTGADFAVLNPATGQEVGRAPNMGQIELDAAVSVAKTPSCPGRPRAMKRWPRPAPPSRPISRPTARNSPRSSR